MDSERSSFQKELTKIARDLVIIHNDVIKRYQICQITNGSVMLSHGRKHKSVQVLFTVEEPNGDFRKPDNRDLHRCIEIVSQSQVLWGMNNSQIDALADDLDANDTLKATTVSDESEQMFRDAAIQVWDEVYGKRRF